jgi:hypothetical protein
MGNCGYCDVDCLYCIEKKETKFDFISENRNKINPKKEIKFNQDKPIENTYISAIKKIKNDDITSMYSLEENTLRKKFNESHETHLDEYNQKDMSSLQILKNKLDVENNKQININIENPNNKILDVDTNIKYFEEMNKEENDDDKQSNEALRYNNTNFKSSNVSFLKYFEKIEDNSKNFDMTNNNINSKRRLTEIFPIKFNYHKDKYINYFADNSI